MIKFFRQIRFNLLSQKQTGRYFKYAIGEILLVVVGILIALQINNWNQERQKRSKEQLYLISFQNDLTKNSIELQRVIDKTDIIKKRADSVLLLKQGLLEYLSDNTFTQCVMGGNGFTIYQAQGGTVKSLIASGDLNVISNDSLRLALATWEDNLLGVKEWEMLLKTSSQEYKNYLDQHLDLIAVDEQGLPINASIRTQLMDSQLFLNHVSNTKRLSRILNSVYEEKMEQLQALQIRVDDAINSF